jgi:hypothetical protein
MIERALATGVYSIECWRGGVLVWEEKFPNQVTTVGATDALEKYFRGSTYTAAWFLGLIVGPGAGNTYSAADTMASHAGWVESVAYSQANRPAASFSAASAATIQTATPAIFSINASAVLGGGFITTNNTKGGTTGVLYSAGNFVQGDRSVVSGDEIRLSYSAQLTV